MRRYLKDQNGAIYCYDDTTAVTLVFKYTRWKVSQYDYCYLKRNFSLQELTAAEAKYLTGGADPDDVLEYYTTAYDVTM